MFLQYLFHVSLMIISQGEKVHILPCLGGGGGGGVNGRSSNMEGADSSRLVNGVG